jgi:hypothetical protein
MEDWFGLGGVAWLAGLAYLAYAAALFAVCRVEGPLLAVVPAVTVAIVASGDGLSARPQVVSYLFVVLSVGAWLRTARTGRTPWWLIGLAWAWANLHGMWPLGIVIGVVAATGLLLRGDGERRSAMRLFAVPVGAAVVSALTPLGPGLYGAVVAVGGRADYLSEWSPPDFTTVFPAVLGLMLAATLLLRLRVGEPDWPRDLLLLLACAFAVYSTRTVPVAAAITAPLLVGYLQRLLPARTQVTRAEVATLLGGLLAALVVMGFVVSRVDLEPDRPAWLDNRLAQLPADTPVLTDSGWGGYVMWKSPETDTLLHGYIDVYSDAELAHIDTMLGVTPGWEDAVGATGAEYALLRPGSALAYALAHSAGWHVVESSSSLELLRAPS